MYQLVNVMIEREVEESLLKDVVILVNEVIEKTFRVPGFSFKIDKVRVIDKKILWKNLTKKIIWLKIITNNRPLLLGQFAHFPIGGFRGFYPNYFHGYIERAVHDKYGSAIATKYSYCFDVYEDRVHNNNVYRYETLQNLIDKQIVNAESLFAKTLSKYELRYVLMAGSTISGPSISMIKTIEKIQKRFKVTNVLDLFSGTGALTKVSLIQGSKSVTCADTSTDVIEKNLGCYFKFCKILNIDIFKYNFRDHPKYDLVLIDPFYDYSLDVAKTIVPKIKKLSSLFIFHTSETLYKFWMHKILSELRRHFPNVKYSNVLGSSIAICSNRSSTLRKK